MTCSAVSWIGEHVKVRDDCGWWLGAEGTVQPNERFSLEAGWFRLMPTDIYGKEKHPEGILAHTQEFHPPNVKEHATPLAGASVEMGVEVHTTGDVADRAASGGCCVSSCSALEICHSCLAASVNLQVEYWSQQKSKPSEGPPVHLSGPKIRALRHRLALCRRCSWIEHPEATNCVSGLDDSELLRVLEADIYSLLRADRREPQWSCLHEHQG
jgi:hypothetical protein